MNRKEGSVIVEFVILAPLFLCMTMLICEMSLLWVDRYMMRLATFEAARKCLEDPVNGEKRAKTSAALRMAAVAPSVEVLARHLGVDIEPASGQNPALIRNIVTRFPMAYASTYVRCRYDANDRSVMAELRYWRAAKMPLMKGMFWSAYLVNQIGGSLGPLDVEIDEMFYGVKVSEGEDIQRYRERIRSILDTARGLSNSLRSVAGDIADIPFVQDIMEPLEGADISFELPSLRAEMRDLSRAATMMVLAVPDELRLVPYEMKVRLVEPGYKNEGNEWDKGQAFGVARFDKKSGTEHWYEWARELNSKHADFSE